MSAVKQRGKVARMSATVKNVLTGKTRPMSPAEIKEITTMRTGVELVELLQYRNNAVVAKFMKELKLAQGAADQLFQDMLKFLYVGATVCPVCPPPKIDKAWHLFILFTMDYQQFCHKYFGRFIHHRPRRPEDKPGTGAELETSSAVFSEHLGDLGPNWVFPKSMTASMCKRNGECYSCYSPSPTANAHK